MIDPERNETGASLDYEFFVRRAVANPSSPMGLTYATLALACQQRTANYIGAVDAGLVVLNHDEMLQLNARLGRTP